MTRDDNASSYQVALLEGLPFLEELPRGDFLCDALEWLDETDPERCSRFFLADFHLHVFSTMNILVIPSSRLQLGFCKHTFNFHVPSS